MLTGERVNLRAVELSDMQLFWSWLNDPEVMLYWGRPGNTESLADVTRREQAEAARDTSFKYLIETKEGKPIGQVDYYDLSWQTSSASVSIMVAVKEYWGGGYGTDAMRTLLRYLFLQLHLHRVSLNVHESNVRARRSYEKNGFVAEGVLRDWAYFDGHWVNGVLMSVLDREFLELEAARSRDSRLTV